MWVLKTSIGSLNVTVFYSITVIMNELYSTKSDLENINPAQPFNKYISNPIIYAGNKYDI